MILTDVPTCSLDPTSIELLQILKDLNEKGKTIVIVPTKPASFSFTPDRFLETCQV